MILSTILKNMTNREIKSSPSSIRTADLKERYLKSSLMVDIEYIKYLTDSHRNTEDYDVLIRRAINNAYALSNITPVIHENDTLLGNKTRFIRGAIPYLNYATDPFLKEMRKEEQDAQSKYATQGHGGGIETSLKEAEEKGLRVISGKFLISDSDYDIFKELCEYWEGKSFMDLSKSYWTKEYEHSQFIENGWQIGLYTAPHEPCPEGRLILDYEYALKMGYRAIIKNIEKKIKENPNKTTEIQFWRAAIESMKGAIAFIKNYGNAAAEKGLHEQAETCNQIAEGPATNFREAIQLYWFTYLIGHMEGSHMGYSPGRLDYVLYPYYKDDCSCNQEKAVELFEELFIKMTQIEYIASLSWQGLGHGNLYQNAVLGGLDGDGNPVDNDISLAILQAQINVQMTQPTLSVWYDDKNSERFHLKAVECVKTGVGYPAFFNQKTYIKHELKTSGLPIEIIRKNSAIGGCTEPTLQGCAHGIVQAGFINHGKILDIALNDGVDPISNIRMFETRQIESYDDLRQYYLDIMQNCVHYWQTYWNIVMKFHRRTVPLIFCSVLVNNCVEDGRCMDDGGAMLNNSITTLSSGLVNVANSLAVVKKLCYEDKVCTLQEIKDAIHNNWSNYEGLRKKAMETPHWGNDDDYVDLLFLDLYKEYCECVRKQKNYLDKPYDPSMLAISTPVPFGKVCDAFPDGRLRYEPISDGVTSAFPGTDVNGPTAVIRSSSKVDHTQIRGGLLNLKFHPSALKGVNGSKNLLALIKTYFEKPGFHVQFNIVDSRMLRDAQQHPENYRDLVVRVAGFSAYWVEMSKDLQDQVISRTEHQI